MGSNNNLCINHGRIALSSGNGGSGSKRGHSRGGRARVGLACRGRRGATHSRSEVVSSARLRHGWAREREEMKRMGGGG